MLNTLITVLLTIVIFAVLIFIHEAGHFLTARLCGVCVSEFSVGMGPQIWQTTKNDIKYTLRAIPFGGYCSMQEDEESKDPRAFSNQKPWKRFLILAAGPFMNLILGFLLALIVVAPQETLPTNTISAFHDDAVSNSDGLQVDDTILEINGHAIYTTTDIVNYMISDSSTPDRTFTVLRDGKKVRVDGVTFMTEEEEDGSTGLYIDFYVYPQDNSVWHTIAYSYRLCLTYGRLIWQSLIDLITGKVAFTELSGPVGVGSAVSQAVSAGISTVLMLCVLLTINLGIMNLLPLPALDGGRLLFVVIEMVIRRPVNKKYEAWIHAAGMLFLIGLMIFITMKDIYQLF